MRICPHCGVSILAPDTGQLQRCTACNEPLEGVSESAPAPSRAGVVPAGVSEDDPTDPAFDTSAAVPVNLNVPPPPKPGASGLEFESGDPREAARRILEQLAG